MPDHHHPHGHITEFHKITAKTKATLLLTEPHHAAGFSSSGGGLGWSRAAQFAAAPVPVE
jgi:hypothetical protein